MNIMRPLYFAVPVWGESYVSTFLDYCLPAQLAPKNIPVLAGDKRHNYTIYTTKADYNRIVESPAFQSLQHLISVTFEFIDTEITTQNTNTKNKYHIKSDCYRRALKNVADNHAAVVALNADILLADGFVQTVVDLLSQNKRVIEVPGPRGLRGPIGRFLISNYRGADNVSIVIKPHELSALWLKHKHPQLEMHFVNGPQGAPFHPSHLYWPVGDEGVIIRGFHLYPIVIDPRGSAIDFNTTIDDDLVGNLELSHGEIFLAQDSRNLFCCELSPAEYYVGEVAKRGDIDRYVEFYCSYAAQNINNLKREIIIAGVRELSQRWDIRRKESASFIKHLLKKYHSVKRKQLILAFQKRLSTSILSIIPMRLKAIIKRILVTICPYKD